MAKSKYANMPERLCECCCRRYTRHPSSVCGQCVQGVDRRYGSDPRMSHELKTGRRLGRNPHDEDAFKMSNDQ